MIRQPMLRYVLRRALWAIPTLFGVSLVVFLVTTLLPDPAGENPEETLSLLQLDPERFEVLDEQRREHFLDLPRFVNARPSDVRSRTSEAVAHLVAGDDLAPLAAYRLA